MTSPPLQGFRSVRGHAKVLDLLARAESHGRLASAYLFAGPPGVGKDRVAHALAQRNNCTARLPDGDACGACTACRRIVQGNHPDLLVLQRLLKEPPRPEHPRYAELMGRRLEDTPESDLAGGITIDQVRELIARMPFRPHEGGTRWVIVREADRFRAEAANAFLKTLEEPPTATHFVLLTHRPSMLLSTIRSRCQTVRFGLLDDGDVKAILPTLGLAPEVCDTVTPLADGSVGRALEFADQESLTVRQALATSFRETLAESARSPDNVGGFVELVEGISSRMKADNKGAKDSLDKRDLEAALTLLGRHFRNEAIAAAANPRSSVVMASRATIVREAIEALDGGNNLSPQHVLQSMLVRLREIRS